RRSSGPPVDILFYHGAGLGGLRRLRAETAYVAGRAPRPSAASQACCTARATTPDRSNIMVSASRLSEFFAQLADKDIDDLELGFPHPAVEMLEKHLLRYNRALM